MSIFDSLKYPISIPPTKEQLHAVPKILILKWLHKVRPKWSINQYSTKFLVNIYIAGSKVFEYEVQEENVKYLRKLILEYDESL